MTLSDISSPPASGDVAPARTVAHCFGELVWLLARSDAYKHHSLADLEWMLMPALLLEQFRLGHSGKEPSGALLWARLNEDVGLRMIEPHFRLRPDQWRCGETVWIVDIVTPMGSSPKLAAAMIEDFKRNVFPDIDIRLRRLNFVKNSIEVITLKGLDTGIDNVKD